jgi:hypothetical protein
LKCPALRAGNVAVWRIAGKVGGQTVLKYRN